MEADAEPAGVHRHLQQGAGRRGAAFVTAQQFGRAGEVLGDASVFPRPGQGGGEQPVTGLRQSGGRAQRLLVEDVRHRHRAPGEQFADPAVRIGPGDLRQGGAARLVLGPERAQDQHGPPVRVGEQGVQGGRDALAGLGVAEVVLRLVQPDHGPGRHPLQVGEGGLGPGRVERVPEQPALGRQRPDGFPAGTGLARGRGADQHHQSTAPRPGAAYRLGEHAVVRSPDVARERPPRGDGSGRVDLQLVRVPLRDGPPRRRPLSAGRGRSAQVHGDVGVARLDDVPVHGGAAQLVAHPVDTPRDPVLGPHPVPSPVC